MNQKNISIICIALCLILIGSYILRQNYLLEKAYKTAGIYDYIPAEESKIILEIEQVSQIDSLHLVYLFYDEHPLSYRYGRKYFLRPDYPKPAL